MAKPRHFIDLSDFSPEVMGEIFLRAKSLQGKPSKALHQKNFAAIFEKPSQRTESALGVGIFQSGGNTVKLSGEITERPAHYAHMLGGYYDAAIIRAISHDKLQNIAKHSDIPIINGLTDASHPVLLLADMLTLGRPKGLKIAFIGAATNIAKTYAQACPLFDFQLALGMPQTELDKISDYPSISRHTDAFAAAHNADVIVTDQYGGEGTNPYTVTQQLMKTAKKNAVFMHPMPVSANQHEVELSVAEGLQSLMFPQTKNRSTAFVAVLDWCLS